MYERSLDMVECYADTFINIQRHLIVSALHVVNNGIEAVLEKSKVIRVTDLLVKFKVISKQEEATTEISSSIIDKNIK
jgi:hypothetical protein